MEYLKYYPHVLSEIYEIQAIAKAMDIEFEKLKNYNSQIDNEFFIMTAEGIGLEKWEKLLKINVADKSDVDLRRFDIIAKLMGRNPNLIDSLNMLVGKGNYSIRFISAEMVLEVVLKLQKKEYLGAVKNLLEVVVPMNIVLNISLAYNIHDALSRQTHDGLSKYNHQALTQEVL